MNYNAAPISLYDCPHPNVPRSVWIRYAVEMHRRGERPPVDMSHLARGQS